MDDLENLPNHCSNNKCNWCTERRNRRNKQSIDALIAAMKPSTRYDYWNTKIAPSKDILNRPYPTVTKLEHCLAFRGVGVRYLRERSSGHKKISTNRYNGEFK